MNSSTGETGGPRSSLNSDGSRHPDQSMKIFICEDNALIALMLEDLVEDLGHQACGIADRYDTALAGSLDEGAELVLVDLDLADGPTGLDLVDALAARGLPAIVVSGQADGIDREHRAVAVMRKPVERQALGRVIAGVEPGPANDL